MFFNETYTWRKCSIKSLVTYLPQKRIHQCLNEAIPSRKYSLWLLLNEETLITTYVSELYKSMKSKWWDPNFLKLSFIIFQSKILAILSNWLFNFFLRGSTQNEEFWNSISQWKSSGNHLRRLSYYSLS